MSYRRDYSRDRALAAADHPCPTYLHAAPTGTPSAPVKSSLATKLVSVTADAWNRIQVATLGIPAQFAYVDAPTGQRLQSTKSIAPPDELI